MKSYRMMMTVMVLLLCGACATADPIVAAAPPVPPGMVAAAHPLAAQAGVEILNQGGNAVDAAVATAFALNVVEPHASGIGGGGFLVYYRASDATTHVIDYRERGPAALRAEMARVDGRWSSRPMRSGGLASGAPGMARGLLEAHARFGTLPREALLAPAIRHAEQGMPISSTLARMIEERFDALVADPEAASIYLEDGTFPRTEGSALVQSNLAGVLRAISNEGDAAIYNPETAERIAATLRERGGVMTAEDIMTYRPVWRDPVRATYRGHEVITIGPPSSGGLSALLTLRILERYDLTDMSFDSPEFLAILVHALAESQRATDEVVADPDHVSVPVAALLQDKWTDEAVARITEAIGSRLAASAEPVGAAHSIARIPEAKEHPGNTTHLSVVDRDGNMVALTQTINSFFGSGVMIPGMGIMMNNEMFDYSFEEGAVNAPGPNKRPRSSITPVIVLKDGQPIAAVGTPGGRRIPASLVQILIRTLDFGAAPQEALDAPRLFVDAARRRISYENRFDPAVIEQMAEILSAGGTWELEARGPLDVFFGGAQGIWIERDAAGLRHLVGAADPRRDGAVAEAAR